MIKKNQRFFNIVNVLSDGIIVLASILLAQFMAFSLFNGIDNISTSHYLWVGIWAAILFTTIYMLCGLYESHRSTSFYKEASRLLWASILGTLILLASLYLFQLNDFSRLILLIFFVCSSGLLLIKRCITRMILRHLRKIGFNNKHIVLVGHGATAQNYLKKISANPEFGFIIDGYVSDSESLPSLSWLGSYSEFDSILETFKPDEVVLALPAGEENFLPHLTTTCEKSGIRLSMISCYSDFISSNPRIVMLDGMAMINIRHIPLDNIGNSLVKRISDLIGSVLLVILTSPLMLFTAAGVKLSSPGPIIYRQERVGKNGKHFCIYKFRSMYVNDEVEIPYQMPLGDRPTKFGGWIRKYSIDELPQLFNVIKGDMSIVGPRPEIPYFVNQFREQVPRYMIKHHVLPGMTGWAQVNGLRGNTPIPLRIEYDLFYIENWNILMDLKILWMTLFHLSVKQ